VTLVRSGFVELPPGREPGFDHADVYRAGRRMYVAHTGADRVDVIDCAAAHFLHSLPGLPGVAGVLVDEGQGLLFTSDRAAARVSLFDLHGESLLGQVSVGAHPNGLAYDPGRQRLFAFNLGDPPGEGCTVSVVDADGLNVVAELELPGRPRWAAYDPDRDVVYANIRDPAEIVVIDAANPAIARAFAVPSQGPHGLWLDRGQLFCAADGGDLVVLDRDTGAVLEREPLPGVPDVVMLDPELQRLYVAVGDPGVVCVFDSHPLAPVDTLETEAGAHTLGWDPDGHDLYVFCPGSGGAAVYHEQP
jgi:DNA-binding beta-propeller fold protein YncE